MKKLTVLTICVFLSLMNYAQNYSFSGSISEEVLQNYLERSITMSGLSAVEGNFPTPQERQEEIDMLLDIEAKFIGRIGGWWESGWGQSKLDQIFSNVEQNVCDLKSHDPDIICQGAVFEYVSATVETFNVPSWVFIEFGLPIQNRKFDYQAMLYPSSSPHYSPNTPDMTMQETQMWFYYMARRFIDAGCEALHFGQVEIMNKNDIGNQSWWSMLSRVRNYASSKQNQLMPCGLSNVKYRGVVLCDAHTHGQYLNNTDQLLFDFHSYPLRIQEVNPHWGGNNGGQAIVDFDYCNAIYGKSKGGQTFFGWSTVALPYLVEFDNYGISNNPNQMGTGCFPWGWDEITWFGLQSLNQRNDWLKYVYHKVKCMDSKGFVEMPGRRGMTKAGVPWPGNVYRAAMGNTSGHFNQANTIKDIWNGVYSSPQDWIRKDFSDNFVANSPQPGIAKKNLIFVGSNRMYYIGTDQRVHGYIKYGNVWLTVSPSYASGNVNSQQKVAGDLVANPSGTYLYYRGTNGLFYRYKINNDWSYTYSAMPSNSKMQQQNIIGVGSLICPTDYRMYYIAKETNNGNAKRIHGFYKSGSTWKTMSPSWSSHSNGQNINSQQQVSGDLVSNPSNTYLYYRGTNGLFYRYRVNNTWSYTYSEMPTNSAMQQQNLQAFGALICPTDSRLYYIAYEKTNGWKKRIHGFIKSGNSWSTVSPSWSAHSNGHNINSQQVAYNKLVCSPDNQSIAYLGSDNELHGFDINNNWNYSYFDFKDTPSNKKPRESLIFNQENILFYIASKSGDDKVHFFEYGDDHCENQAVQNIEPNCCMYMVSNQNDEISFQKANNELHLRSIDGKNFTDNDFEIQLYPNPSGMNYVTLEIKGIGEDSAIKVVITDLLGKVFTNQTYNIGKSQILLNIQNLSSGLYVVHVKAEDKFKSSKLIISK